MMLSQLKKAIAMIESQLPEGQTDVDVMIAAQGMIDPVSITGGLLANHKSIPNKKAVVFYG